MDHKAGRQNRRRWLFVEECGLSDQIKAQKKETKHKYKPSRYACLAKNLYVFCHPESRQNSELQKEDVIKAFWNFLKKMDFTHSTYKKNPLVC